MYTRYKQYSVHSWKIGQPRAKTFKSRKADTTRDAVLLILKADRRSATPPPPAVLSLDMLFMVTRDKVRSGRSSHREAKKTHWLA